MLVPLLTVSYDGSLTLRTGLIHVLRKRGNLFFLEEMLNEMKNSETELDTAFELWRGWDTGFWLFTIIGRSLF